MSRCETQDRRRWSPPPPDCKGCNQRARGRLAPAARFKSSPHSRSEDPGFPVCPKLSVARMDCSFLLPPTQKGPGDPQPHPVSTSCRQQFHPSPSIQSRPLGHVFQTASSLRRAVNVGAQPHRELGIPLNHTAAGWALCPVWAAKSTVLPSQDVCSNDFNHCRNYFPRFLNHNRVPNSNIFSRISSSVCRVARERADTVKRQAPILPPASARPCARLGW